MEVFSTFALRLQRSTQIGYLLIYNFHSKRCFNVLSLEKVLIFRDSNGAKTDLLEKVITFCHSCRAIIDPLKKDFFFL